MTMRLQDIFDGVPGVDLSPAAASLDIPALWDDSRRVTPGSLFAALPPAPGLQQDGTDFIANALDQGARAVLVARARLPSVAVRFPGVLLIPADDPRTAFRQGAGRFYGHPSRRVRVLGVTGTNGKTTITYFMESILKAAGRSCGVVGTVNYRVGGRVVPSTNTTPGFLDNQIFLAGLADQGVGHAVMEVSSHALAQGRVEGIDFAGAVFTNLTGDHLDYHRTMEDYFQAKARLFTGLAPGACAAVNVDDPFGRRLPAMTRGRVLTYGLETPADISARIEAFTLAGTRLALRFPGGEITLDTHFLGRHNIYNILASFAAAFGEGIDPSLIRRGIEDLAWVPGRLERVNAGQDFCVFIDYAHTDDGLRNVLQCLKTVPHGRLIVVFGCGGDRDRTKRPRMGRAADELADHVILTSDNPRSEDPRAIIDEIIPGLRSGRFEVIVDREAAIARALALARQDDIVLLAGKGHETYQVLRDRTVDFVERDIVTRILLMQNPPEGLRERIR